MTTPAMEPQATNTPTPRRRAVPSLLKELARVEREVVEAEKGLRGFQSLITKHPYLRSDLMFREQYLMMLLALRKRRSMVRWWTKECAWKHS